MTRWLVSAWIAIGIGGGLGACGGSGSGASAAPEPAPSAAPAVPVTPAPASAPAIPAAPAQPAHPAVMPAGAEADNPCAAPEPQTLTLELGVLQSTAWKLDVMYAVDDDRKLGPGFIFLLHQGERRWETRRDAHNWSVPMLWRGFCWRGLEYPKARAKQVQVQVAPLCKDGKLLESGKCSAVFKGR